MRPDGFRAPAAFVSQRDACKPEIQGSGDGYRFGQVPFRLHRDGCVFQLFEGKSGKNLFKDDELADPIEYGTYVKSVCVVLLFNALEFVLYRAENGQPKAMRKGQWTTPGAAQAIQTFFASARGDPPLLSLLHSVVDITACSSVLLGPWHLAGRAFWGQERQGMCSASSRLPTP